VLELVHESLRQLHLRHPSSPDRVGDRALELLLGYSWPGNVRELRNVLERALVLSPGDDAIGPEHLPEALRAPGAPRAQRTDGAVLTLKEMEQQHIERVLYMSEGNRTLAAQRLAISRATLHAKIKEYGMEHVGRDDDATP
jgi:transcriptional regulator with PAS, ATPase and Fis domain